MWKKPLFFQLNSENSFQLQKIVRGLRPLNWTSIFSESLWSMEGCERFGLLSCLTWGKIFLIVPSLLNWLRTRSKATTKPSLVSLWESLGKNSSSAGRKGYRLKNGVLQILAFSPVSNWLNSRTLSPKSLDFKTLNSKTLHPKLLNLNSSDFKALNLKTLNPRSLDLKSPNSRLLTFKSPNPKTPNLIYPSFKSLDLTSFLILNFSIPSLSTSRLSIQTLLVPRLSLGVTSKTITLNSEFKSSGQIIKVRG